MLTAQLNGYTAPDPSQEVPYTEAFEMNGEGFLVRCELLLVFVVTVFVSLKGIQ